MFTRVGTGRVGSQVNLYDPVPALGGVRYGVTSVHGLLYIT